MELRRKSTGPKYPKRLSLSPLLTETENGIIAEFLALVNKNDVTSQQSLNSLEWLGGII